MTAVYKRELRSYLTSMIGYLFIIFYTFTDRNLFFCLSAGCCLSQI